MDLSFPDVSIENYKSPTQIARVLTEAWAAGNLYCAACSSDHLVPTKNNAQAVDLLCPECKEGYQLKAGRVLPRVKIVDGAYGAMISAIRSDVNPNLLYLHYSLLDGVANLALVPRFFFAEACIEKRNPLSQNARRAGWVGCNIRWDRIASEGRIQLVSDGAVLSKDLVRAQYLRLSPLRDLDTARRGWTLTVLQLISSLGAKEFTLAEAYTFEAELSIRYPNNRNIRPKIRQQLQVLRDKGLITFLGGSSYRLTI